MTVYSVVDNKGNVYGVTNSEVKARIACVKLKEKDCDIYFDYIACPMNEIEFDGEIIYRG